MKKPGKENSPELSREARLKSALKANIAKRKAQAAARGAKAVQSDGPAGERTDEAP